MRFMYVAKINAHVIYKIINTNEIKNYENIKRIFLCYWEIETFDFH